MKLLTIIGARPQFIKAAAFSRAVSKIKNVNHSIIHTGQHYDTNMSANFFNELGIPKPNYQLQLKHHMMGSQIAEMILGIEPILTIEKPDIVIVYGDTNSTLAGAIAASKLNIKLAHIEAGLRSFNRSMPEEINRITTDHISDYLFTPTEFATSQLRKENIPSNRIFQVGDVMIDALLYYSKQAHTLSKVVENLNLSSSNFILLTIHRAENTNSPVRLKNIVEAVSALSEKIKIVFPLHPRTRKALHAYDLLNKISEKVHLIPPVGYLDLLALQKLSLCVITDSGGIQKEAYFNKKPCITLRDETEWRELIEIGANTLCSPEKPFSFDFFEDHINRNLNQIDLNFYGRGNACELILDKILNRETYRDRSPNCVT